MSLDRQNLDSFTLLRRIVLGILTVFVLYKLILIGTIDRPPKVGNQSRFRNGTVVVGVPIAFKAA